MTDHLSVHDRLKRLEHVVQLAEERESANLRRIEQLASRVRDLEMTRGELEAERDALAVSLRVMVNQLDASMTRVAELESVLVELKPSGEQLAARVRELEIAKETADDYAEEMRERAGE